MNIRFGSMATHIPTQWVTLQPARFGRISPLSPTPPADPPEDTVVITGGGGEDDDADSQADHAASIADGQD